ncbi:multidrug effflux MFS transporter [Rhodococcus sp. NPDC056960]|uniref:multidrug effflux MFS transporter n=1 Tax=Rhodococcus sp. NPDC056960 TaxID=3345982 RepID=UPI0036409B1C
MDLNAVSAAQPLRDDVPAQAPRSGSVLPGTLITMLAALAALAPLGIDMYLPAFPAMAVEFGTSASAIQLTLTAFLIGLAVGQLIFGPMSDRFGRRRLLLAGTLVCVLATGACAWAPSIELLTVFRFVQGFTGAAGIVLSRAVISDRAHGKTAAKMFSLLIVINAVAPVIAPLLGGTLIGFIGWRGVFCVLGAIAAVTFLGVLAWVPESHPRERRTSGGFPALARDARDVLGNRRYLGFTLAYAFSFAVMFAYISASPFVLQNVHGLSTTWYTVAFTCNAVGLVVVSGINAKLVERIDERKLLRLGVALLVIFSAVMLINALIGPVLWVTLVVLWCTVASLGLVIANATTLAIGEARNAVGTGSAVLGALQYGFAALVSPIVGVGGEHTAAPMAVTMIISAAVAAVALVLAGSRSAESTV